MKRSLIVLFLFLSAIFWFRETKVEPLVFSGIAMTVPYRILVGHSLSDPQIQQIEKTIHQIFSETHEIYNKWNPLSELSKLNSLDAEVEMSLSPKLLSLLIKTEEMWKITLGKFDPTVESLKQIPSMGWNYLELYAGKAMKKIDGLKIDLGGIAKGQTIDELTLALNDLGYPNLLVEWGGDFRASGSHPSGRSWMISIKNPNGGSIEEVSLKERSLATSGDYEQFWIDEKGSHLTHIWDPSTSNPLERKKDSMISCSVMTETCVEADAIATALMLFSRGESLNRWVDLYLMDHPEASFHFVFQEE